jgi:hypothetical protein
MAWVGVGGLVFVLLLLTSHAFTRETSQTTSMIGSRKLIRIFRRTISTVLRRKRKRAVLELVDEQLNAFHIF